MLGVEGVIDLVVARLSAEMPAKIVELEARYTTDIVDVALRPPALYAPSLYERLELAQYPAVEVEERTDGRPAWMDQNAGIVELRIPYAIRVYLTERGNGFGQVSLRRRRLTLAIREVLFSTALLANAPVPAWIDVNSVTTSYFGIGSINDNDSRSIAATYTDLTVIVEEMTEPAPSVALGVAATVSSSVHPADR